MHNFSENLVEEAREYFRELSGKEVSRQQAEEWLDSMAGFFSWFAPEKDALKVEKAKSNQPSG